ncbi:hypothetical protein WA1_51920 [Scytonema hofmannii PCC 7110]|uniref:Uncharacterized protein n=1 Tax=Scytonema hofmannii PCC 7110 TaxID=128403 RepID=A0A139XHX3_9CYAN|nr:hypothetical protein WA1_51920 [Scytonema hofmannii PCC 7110]
MSTAFLDQWSFKSVTGFLVERPLLEKVTQHTDKILQNRYSFLLVSMRFAQDVEGSLTLLWAFEATLD